MRLLIILILINLTEGNSQILPSFHGVHHKKEVIISGTINYKSYQTHYGNGSNSTYNGVTYSGVANSEAEFDAMFDTNQPGTTLTHSGEVSPYGSTGLRGGLPSRWGNDYFAIVYTGWFKPNKTGSYGFMGYADDGHQARYREVGTTTWQRFTHQWGCCSVVYGSGTLDSSKWYEFEIRYQEYGGAAYYLSLIHISEPTRPY